MLDSTDLLTQIRLLKGTVGVTYEDDATPDGSPGLMSEAWHMNVFDDGVSLTVNMQGVFWIEEDVELKAWIVSPTNTISGNNINVSFEIGGFFLGDFAQAWTPDASPP